MTVFDISAYQGKIDIQKVCFDLDVAGLIFRTTIKSGNLDSACKEYMDAAFDQRDIGNIKYVAGYKFSYSRTYYDAFLECMQTLITLDEFGLLYPLDHFYLDLEDWSCRPYTTSEANEVIKGYMDACKEMNVPFGLYFNLNYLRNIVDKRWSFLPLWVARYNKELGDTSPWKPWLWQYSSEGIHEGIEKRVDVNEVLNYEYLH